jgi:myosin I
MVLVIIMIITIITITIIIIIIVIIIILTHPITPLLPLPQELYPADAEHASTGARGFLGNKFRDDVNNLCGSLRSTQPHFIRCIKPNTTRKPLFVEPSLVLNQLQYLAVLDSIRVRRTGFAFREPYPDFFTR